MKVYLLIMTASLVWIACRKIDKQSDLALSEENKIEKFFTQNRSSDPHMEAIRKMLEGVHKKNNFAETTIKKVGYPRWNKSFIAKPSGISLSETEDTVSITYIPFVRDSQNYVNASLLVKTSPTDTSFQFLLDWQYSSYGFGSQNGSWDAKDVFHLFALFDRNVFGRTTFKITDKRIFGDTTIPGNVIVKVKPQTNPQLSEILTMVTMCDIYDVCYGPADDESWCGGGCDANCIYYTHTETDCTTFWVEDGWTPAGGGSGGGNGGSGGGGGTTSPTPPDCNTPIPIEVEENPIPCGPGWTPTGGGTSNMPPPNDSTICEQLKRLISKVQDSTKNTLDSLHTKAQQNGNERAFSYQLFHNDTIVYYIVEGDVHSSKPHTGFSLFGINHTHQDNGLPVTNSQSDANQNFDTDDILKFYADHTLSQGGKCLIVQTVTTRDYIYAAYITDIDQFKANIISQAGTSIYSAMTNNLYFKYDSILNSCTAPPTCTYERRSELALLGIFGASNSGIKFFKSPKTNINFVRL